MISFVVVVVYFFPELLWYFAPPLSQILQENHTLTLNEVACIFLLLLLLRSFSLKIYSSFIELATKRMSDDFTPPFWWFSPNICNGSLLLSLFHLIFCLYAMRMCTVQATRWLSEKKGVTFISTINWKSCDTISILYRENSIKRMKHTWNHG